MRKEVMVLYELAAWYQRFADFSGFSDTNTVEVLLRSPGRTNKQSHIILTPDKPARLGRAERALEAIRPMQARMLIASFFLPPKEDGKMRTRQELADMFGLHSVKEYKNKLYRAKTAFIGELSRIDADFQDSRRAFSSN